MQIPRISPLRLLAALAGIVANTGICLLTPFNSSTVGFAYLILVLGVATLAGLGEAIIASVAAMLTYNFFFLPPVGRFTIADPQNLVALCAFLVTALVASHLSDRAKRQALEAKGRQRETEQLYALSRAILLTDTQQPIGSQAAQHIAGIFDAPSVVVFDAKSGVTYWGGPESLAGIESALKEIVLQGTHHHKDGIDIWPIALGGHPIGALAARGIRITDAAVQALLNLVAIALERVRTEEAANKAEVARQGEEFKSTLLDAIAHEFKTPLTSIKAASTSLLSGSAAMSPEQSELASIIDEEADRLSLLVTEAVKMSQIDAGKVKLNRSAASIDSLVSAAASRFSGRGSERVQWQGAGQRIPAVFVDAEMITLALRQIIDNGLKYSTPATPIKIGAKSDSGHVEISVSDQGPGVPEKEHDQIFDKFYRRASDRNKVPGTGLGLHIAREIVRAHDGDLWIESGRGGAEFHIRLPRYRGTPT